MFTMIAYLLRAAPCLFLVALPLSGQTQESSRFPANEPRTKCADHGDPAYMVCHGAWSSKAVSLFNTWTAFDTNPERHLDLPSPDGSKIIRVRGFHARIRISGKQFWTPFGNMHDAEVGWAPDSTRLFVTWTDGGASGGWHTQVYDVTQSGLAEVAGVTQNVRPDLVRRMKKAAVPKWVRSQMPAEYWHGLEYCADDVVGSQWLNGSSEILVSGLAGPDSDCKYMGDFVTYRIDIATGKILQAYTEKEAQRLFGSDDLPRIAPDDDEL
jgi:hypothetical protein